MPLAHFAQIRLLHVACVALSGALFAARGLLRIAGLALAHHRVLRLASYLIDSTLLTAAILLTLIVHQYPFVDAWLTAKLLLLPIYIGLGIIALRHARTRRGQVAALLAALLVFTWIIGIAITRDPAGWLLRLRQ